jgi:hypothetical protein
MSVLISIRKPSRGDDVINDKNGNIFLDSLDSAAKLVRKFALANHAFERRMKHECAG